MKKKTLKTSRVKDKSKAKHFFKKKEKLFPSFQFPNIFRIITERYFLVFLVSFALALMLAIVGLDLYKDVKEQQRVEKEKKEIVSEIQYWQGIVDKYKDYRDAYFQLAVLEYRLKNFDKARFHLNQALIIDPNFEKGRDLEEVLNQK